MVVDEERVEQLRYGSIRLGLCMFWKGGPKIYDVGKA